MQVRIAIFLLFFSSFPGGGRNSKGTRMEGDTRTDNAMQVGVCKLNQQRGRGAQGKKREGTRVQ